MKHLTLILLIVALSITSCLKYNWTSVHGVRLENPKKFEFSKKMYANSDRSKIDTNSIYQLISLHGWGGVSVREGDQVSCKTARFFSTGQVLFYYSDTIIDDRIFNNEEAGEPGYYYVYENQLKIERWRITNGGQLEYYFGTIQNDGNIKFYEQAVGYYSSYRNLEKKNIYSIWAKKEISNINHYKPDW